MSRHLAQLSLCLLLVSSVGCALDRKFVFHPTVHPEGTWQPPGLAFEDAWFESADGTKLHGWYVPHPNPRATLLVCHGNAGNLSDRWPIMRLYRDHLGADAMIFDYRGYGRSAGKPEEHGVLADARAARTWLSRRTGVHPQDIVLVGRSLGGGVAVDLAANDGARGLVLESTFTSVPDTASRLMPWTPVRYLMSTQFNSLAKIPKFKGPLLQSHGDEDRLIAIDDAKRLHAAALKPKKFVTIPGAGHNWLPTPEYVAELSRFLDTLPRHRSESPLSTASRK